MTHEEALAVLPEVLREDHRNRIDPGWAAHLATCGECRALAVAYDTVSAALHRRRLEPGGTHPTSTEIVSYALAGGLAQGSMPERVEAHLRECSACEELVAATRGADRAASAGSWLRPLTSVAPGTRALLAAAALLVVLVYPAYLGIVRLPRLSRQAEEARAIEAAARREAADLRSSLDKAIAERASAMAWSGPVDLTVLESTARGVGEANVLRLRPGQPFFLVGVLAPLSAAARPAETWRFAIGPPRQAPLWTEDLPVAQVREKARTSGVVTFAIPAALLPPGDYRLVVTAPSRAADSRPLLEVSFAVAPPE